MKKRFDILDAWRSLAILLMVTYHFLYDLALFGVITWQQMFSTPLNIMQKFICCSFIFLAGASARFSRNNLRHGLIVLAAHIAVVIGALVGGQTIRFGVLALLGCSMVIWHFVGKHLQKLPGGFLAGLCGALFLLSDKMVESISVSAKWLYPLGFTYPGFSSADYFPLIPWLFLFLVGTAFGGWCLNHRENKVLTAPLPAPLTFLGRHSLLIYVLHQPVLFGLSFLLWG